jgi:hypothetical protein
MADVISHIKAIYKLYNKTDMYFLAVEYASVNINFSVHITSYSTAKKSIFVKYLGNIWVYMGVFGYIRAAFSRPCTNMGQLGSEIWKKLC